MIKYTIVGFNIVSLILSIIILTILIVKKYRTQVHNAYIFFQSNMCLWTFGNIFSLIVKDNLSAKIWIWFQYLGLAFLGASSLILSLYYCGVKFKKSIIKVILTPSFATLFFLFTNDFHHKFYTNITTTKVGYEILFWIHASFSYIYIFLSIIIYIVNLIKDKNKSQYFIMLCATLIPFAFNVLYVFDIINPKYDLTPSLFMIVNFIYAIAIFNFRMFEIIPLASSMILENMEYSIIIVNRDNQVIDTNNAALNLLQSIGIEIKKDYLINKIITRLEEMNLDEKEIFERFISSIKILPNISSRQTIHLEANSYYEINYSPIMDKKHNYFGFILIIKDVTEYMRLCNELNYKNEILKKNNKNINKLYKKEKEYNELTNDFITVISHEFRTPLNVIKCALQIIDKDDENGSGKNIRWLKMIEQNSLRLMKLVNNLLECSKMDAGFTDMQETNIEVVSFTANIVDSIESYAKVKDIEVIYIPNDENIYSIIDHDKLEKVILNLLSNAFKFTDSAGKIVVSVGENEDSFYISVKDSGIGIRDEEKEIIFDKFRQCEQNLLRRKTEGTGIGLALVNNLVKVMGGNIILNSQYGYGSEFLVTFPKKDQGLNEELKCKSLIHEDINEKVSIEFSDIYN